MYIIISGRGLFKGRVLSITWKYFLVVQDDYFNSSGCLLEKQHEGAFKKSLVLKSFFFLLLSERQAKLFCIEGKQYFPEEVREASLPFCTILIFLSRPNMTGPAKGNHEREQTRLVQLDKECCQYIDRLFSSVC